MIPKDILICKLKSDQHLDFFAIASFNKSSVHAMYSVGNAYFEEYDKTFTLYIESLGQYSCKDIFNMACDIYIEKLLHLQILINEHEDSENNHLKIKIENENHTLGCLFIAEIQQLPEIIFAGYDMEHLSINNLIIEINSSGSHNIKNVTATVINKLQKDFNNFKLK